jgi:hypothetical protein
LEPVEFKIVSDGDITYVELVSAETVENIKNMNAIIKNGIHDFIYLIGSDDNSTAKVGLVIDGSSKSGSGAIHANRPDFGAIITHIDIGDVAQLYGAKGSIKGKPMKNLGKQSTLTRRTIHSDITNGTSFIKQGLNKGSDLSESVMKNVKELQKKSVSGNDNIVFNLRLWKDGTPMGSAGYDGDKNRANNQAKKEMKNGMGKDLKLDSIQIVEITN